MFLHHADSCRRCWLCCSSAVRSQAAIAAAFLPAHLPALQLVELQEDAWKLQMLVELQRMGQQLERLASQEDEAITGTKDPGSAEQTAQDIQAAAGPSTGA
jgi:hypothetical protein